MCVPHKREGLSYLNTDLDLVSGEDLSPLAQHFGSAGLSVLHCGQDPSTGQFRACVEAGGELASPEESIEAILPVIESMPEEHRSAWRSCETREFNMGFESGPGPQAWAGRLSAGLVERIAASGAGVGMTIHPATPIP
jgi:hypothetical protein